MYLQSEDALESLFILIHINEISGWMTINPLADSVTLGQNSVFIPFSGFNFPNLKSTGDPLAAWRIRYDLLSGVSENFSPSFLVKLAIMPRSGSHNVALVSGDHIQPEIGTGHCPIMNTTVSSIGNTHLNAEVEVLNRGCFPGKKTVHLQGTIRFPDQYTILLGP
jgi:hypothetical protein